MIERYEVVSVAESNGNGNFHVTIDYELRVFRLGNEISHGHFVRNQEYRSGRGWREQLRQDAIDYLRGIDT
jgi:hypothetical protein